jgi:hypothetical protein
VSVASEHRSLQPLRPVAREVDLDERRAVGAEYLGDYDVLFAFSPELFVPEPFAHRDARFSPAVDEDHVGVRAHTCYCFALQCAGHFEP